MKNAIYINNYDSYITNEALSVIFNNISIDPQHEFDSEVKVTLWHLSVTKTGYGHWKVSVELELNERKLTITHTTTDSMSIDDYNSEEGDIDGDWDAETETWSKDAEERRPRGFGSLLSQCITNNEEEIINFVLEADEE